MSSNTRTTTAHSEIRRWADEHHGVPATARDAHEDGKAEDLRIDLPGGTDGDQLEQVSWDDWFEKFDQNQLAFLYQARKADGEDSSFFKLIRRD